MPQPYAGQEWKHGWIPLTPGAARSKNHGREPRAGSILDRIAAEASAKPGDNRAASRQADAAIRKAAGRSARTDPRQEKLAHKIATQPVTGQRRLGGASARTDLLDLADGTRVIRKREGAGGSDMHNPDAEEASSLLARKLGLPAPAVHRDGDDLYMEYVNDGVTPEEEGAWAGDLPARFARVPDSDQGKLVGLLDVLTHNTDRNTGNWMLNGRNELIPIDHGASYGDYITSSSRPSMEYVNSPFADHYRGANPLTAADIAEIRTRLNDLRPDFERLGHTPWLDYSQRTLDHLAGNASGTRNLVAGVR